jgi:hypothetical protein
MAENGNFDRLVSGLALEERQNLLEKLKGQSNISPEPLYLAEESGVLGIDEQYERLPWYFRLWFFIVGLFKTKPPVKIFEDRQVAEMGKRIEELSPGVYDYQKTLLLPPFYAQMERLKEASRFFYTALDAGFNRDKGAFFGFLGSLEMDNVHRKLQTDTDPNVIGGQYPDAGETDIRQVAFKAMDDAMGNITEELRNAMYHDARSLYCLKALSSFLFDRVLMAFTFNTAVNGQVCSVAIIRDLLMSLDNILVSLKTIPPMPLLESLFIFLLQERSGEPGFNINKEIRTLLAKAEDALAVIREFNKQVPLTKILRCSSRNMALSPHEISGGEDWFVIYHEYWKHRIEASFADYLSGRRRRELFETFRYFFKGANLKLLGNAASEANPNGIPLKGAFDLSFLLTFYTAVFMPDINPVLRPILIDGEFVQKENRMEFDESYNDLIRLEDDIRKFEMKISPSGEYGMRYEQARQDMASLPVKRRKIQLAVEEASSEAAKIVESARRASRSMIGLLGGIANTGAAAKYESLANIHKLAGKGAGFANSLTGVVQKLQKVIQILDNIDAIDAMEERK